MKINRELAWRLACATVAAGVAVGLAVALQPAAARAAAAQSYTGPGSVESETYGCVSESGAFDYYEFRTPIPHGCYYSGEHQEELPTLVLAVGQTFSLDFNGTTLTCTVVAATAAGQSPSISCPAASSSSSS
jgi:hypothetical protein